MALLLSSAATAAHTSVLAIQALRAAAAISVVVHHSIRAYTVNLPPKLAGLPGSIFDIPWFYGALAAGVDIFFVISGFIMVLVAAPYVEGRKPVHDFWARRIMRIYPPYLVATLLIIAFLVNNARHGNPQFDLSMHRIVGAITLFPTFDADRLVQPILGVGWTLSYEMYFYLLFGLAILVGRRRYLPVLAGLILTILLVARLVPGQTAAMVFLRDSVVLEFLFGCTLGWLYTSGRVLNAGILVLTAAAGAIFLASYLSSLGVFSPEWRFLHYGIPAAVIVASMLRLDVFARVKWPEVVIFLGAASYSIYLVHVIVIYFVLPRAAYPLLTRGVIGVDIAIVACVFASIAAGAAFHAWIEKPMQSAAIFGRTKRGAA